MEIPKPLGDRMKEYEEQTLHETLNSIYSFKDDDEAISDISKFEDYRRHYPERYEWRHFNTQFELPKNIKLF